MSSVIENNPLTASAPQTQPLAPHDLRARTHGDSRTQGEAPAVPRSTFLPLLLAGLALLGWLGFQAQQQLAERQLLQTAYASQQQTVDSAGKLRAALDVLSADTQRLADSGNPNARALVEELKRRGVTINSAITPPAGAAPAAR